MPIRVVNKKRFNLPRGVSSGVAVGSGLAYNPGVYPMRVMAGVASGVGLANYPLVTPGQNTAFPTLETAGLPAGWTPVQTNPTLVSGTTYNDCLFTGGIDLGWVDWTNNIYYRTYNDLVFNRCKFQGRIDCSYGGPGSNDPLDIQMNDCEIDAGGVSGVSAIGARGITLRRCHVWHASVCFQGQRGPEQYAPAFAAIYDSFIGPVWGVSPHHCSCISVISEMHMEHNTLWCDWAADEPGNAWTGDGGMSAPFPLYSHGSAWGPQNNVMFKNNLIVNTDNGGAVYSGYWGTSDPTNRLTNCVMLDNQFRRRPGLTSGGQLRSSAEDMGSAPGVDIAAATEVWGTGTYCSGNVYEGESTLITGIPQ